MVEYCLNMVDITGRVFKHWKIVWEHFLKSFISEKQIFAS